MSAAACCFSIYVNGQQIMFQFRTVDLEIALSDIKQNQMRRMEKHLYLS